MRGTCVYHAFGVRGYLGKKVLDDSYEQLMHGDLASTCATIAAYHRRRTCRAALHAELRDINVAAIIDSIMACHAAGGHKCVRATIPSRRRA